MCETFVDTTVTYTLQLDGKFYVIENVPAQVCKETGEEFFSPETVEHIHEMMQGAKTPVRKMETPVFEYA
ncbi:YgiT-type zinc finger protein [Desulfonatronum thiodismutans]|uniref:YgiT-type zinc finger protein n=1 Tax=Desulfonatronum thiodismutans TaxID=159290 RepID=UPI0004ABD8D6|nr:YgiT-type zinc finger protein [Desulfonatronum thiodismutans]